MRLQHVLEETQVVGEESHGGLLNSLVSQIRNGLHSSPQNHKKALNFFGGQGAAIHETAVETFEHTNYDPDSFFGFELLVQVSEHLVLRLGEERLALLSVGLVQQPHNVPDGSSHDWTWVLVPDSLKHLGHETVRVKNSFGVLRLERQE